MGAEVTSISASGFRLRLGDRELVVPFKEFPWFRTAEVGQLLNVQWPSAHHLYWPDLDIDLAVESIEYPSRFPLVSAARSDGSDQPTRRGVAGGAKRGSRRAVRR